MPAYTARIIKKLNASGFQAYAVGGCVRDALMGMAPYDWDVCTSARPDEIAACFAAERVIPTGIKHGTVTVVLDGAPTEVTTFRREGVYSDGRRPDSVQFISCLREDLSRRDFTINAMAYAPDMGLVDVFGGRDDIALRLIRCVGDPKARFREDALRILRALRFASRLGFEIEPGTERAMHECRLGLERIAPERIFAELRGILAGEYVRRVLDNYPDIIAAAVPGYIGSKPATRAAGMLKPDGNLRLAAFLMEMGEDGAKAALEWLRCDNRTKDEVLMLVSAAELPIPKTQTQTRRLLVRLGVELAEGLFNIKAAFGADVSAARELLREVLDKKPCLKLGNMAVSGRDMLALGVEPGPEVGRMLEELFEKLICGELENDAAALLTYAEAMIRDRRFF